MNWQTITLLFLGFLLMWCFLAILAQAIDGDPETDDRIQSLLDHEAAAHEGFMRTLRRITGRSPE